jgi:hypothetical protein
MQIIELYIKGYNRLEGGITGFASNKLVDNTGVFNTSVSVGDIVTNKRTHLTASITAIDSDTQLSLSADLFTSPNTDQYIIESDYFRADLFEDESITITDTLLNLKDIGKVFTPFSQQFNLPASKTNNKLFRHYEKQNVLNSFDARFKHDAVIKLNGIDYKKGKIQFKSVTLKDNKAHAYKVVFFGDAVVLKEIIGDTTLQGLIYDNAYNFTYNETNIINFFSAGSSSLISNYGSDDIIVPNIHHSKNMRYSTNDGYKDSITDTGLVYTDLKPAIRLRAIIEAIERTYSEISFEGFFNTFDFSNFYMWMHKNEGYVTNAVEGGGVNISVNRFRNQDDEDPKYTYTSGTIGDVRTLYLLPYYNADGVRNRYNVTLSITTSTAENYTVRIKNGATGNLITSREFTNQSGTVNIEEGFRNTSGVFGSSPNNLDLLDLIIEIESENTITMTHTLSVEYERKPQGSGAYVTQWTANYTPTNQDVQNTFEISRQMPEMKVMDFLSGLFKMFNLLVYKDGDNIKVELAKVYYQNEDAYDITKYVDMEKATVDRLFQFREMDFKFKSKESFLVQFSDEIQTVPFAEEHYPPDNTPFDGGIYKVELPFEKMMYERLTDTDDDSLTLIGQGAFLNKQFDPTIGEPLIFLSIYDSNADNELTIGSLTPNAYRRPSNVTGLGWWGYNRRLQMNFGLEADEFLGEIPSNSTNLFEDGYFDYVQTMFDPASRLFKYTAYLPLSILLKLQLKDKLVIANNAYRINSIKTNLLTNKTELELYNRQEFVSQINNSQFAYLDRVAQVTSPSKSSTAINLSWTAVTGAVGYDVILNGGVFGTTVGTSVKVTPLEPDTTYTLGVRAKYNIDGNDAYSFDTSIVVTTDPPPVALAEDGDTLITEVGDTIILE